MKASILLEAGWETGSVERPRRDNAQAEANPLIPIPAAEHPSRESVNGLTLVRDRKSYGGSTWASALRPLRSSRA